MLRVNPCTPPPRRSTRRCFVPRPPEVAQPRCPSAARGLARRVGRGGGGGRVSGAASWRQVLGAVGTRRPWSAARP